MNVFIEMSQEAYGRREWDRPFDQIRECAEQGVKGLRIVEFAAGGSFSRVGGRVEYSWTDAKRVPHRLKPDLGVAFFRRGDNGEMLLHAQNF